MRLYFCLHIVFCIFLLGIVFFYNPPSRLNFGSGEVATGPRSESPIIDVEAVSDEESEAKQSVVGQLKLLCWCDKYECENYHILIYFIILK